METQKIEMKERIARETDTKKLTDMQTALIDINRGLLEAWNSGLIYTGRFMRETDDNQELFNFIQERKMALWGYVKIDGEYVGKIKTEVA